MSKQPLAVFGYLLIAAMLGACASKSTVMVPETKPGDQIQVEHLIGEWCTNRNETANSNQAAGFSGLLNISPVYWRFDSENQWDGSASGFMYQPLGKWQLDGLDNLILTKNGAEPQSYRASFKNGEEGPDLYLIDDKGQFRVLARC
ncbi:MAG: hypothetical protein GY785_12155 [Gammaproteobacteria bacterium]|nr:hypothetical protein [Gammaproteobacteria bacterium]